MDPNAKKLRAAKRYIRALALIKQGCQLNGWAVVKPEEDTEIYIVGKPEMVIYAKELLNEAVRPTTHPARATGSLELGASSKDDSEASHAEAALPKEPIEENRVYDGPEGPFDFARNSKKA